MHFLSPFTRYEVALETVAVIKPRRLHPAAVLAVWLLVGLAWLTWKLLGAAWRLLGLLVLGVWAAAAWLLALTRRDHDQADAAVPAAPAPEAPSLAAQEHNAATEQLPTVTQPTVVQLRPVAAAQEH